MTGTVKRSRSFDDLEAEEHGWWETVEELHDEIKLLEYENTRLSKLFTRLKRKNRRLLAEAAANVSSPLLMHVHLNV